MLCRSRCFLVRGLESFIKWGKARLSNFYLHKRGEELEEETIGNMIKKVNELEKLKDMFVDKEIDDYRWEIINFATRITDKKPCNKDSYKHCIRTYEKYEKLLEEYNLTNGEVDISMEVVNDSYEKKLKEGF